MEAGLRIAGVSYPIFHRLESLRGWAPWPEVEGRWTKEGDSHVAINRAGYRDHEYPLQKPAGSFRVAILGDSMTEAFGVSIENTFWTVLQQRLQACDAYEGRQIEVLNFGVSGYGTAQQLLTLQHSATHYAPDVVLLAFYAGNDIINNEPRLDGHPDRVYFALGADGLRLDASNTAGTRFIAKRMWLNTKNAVTNSSGLFQLIREGYYRLKAFRKNRTAVRSADPFNPKAPEAAVFLPPADPDWQQGWTKTEALLRATRDVAVKGGAKFQLALISQPQQVHPDQGVRDRYREALGVPDLDYPDRRLAALAHSEGIPVVVLAPPLRAYAQETAQYLHGFVNTRLGTGHLNAEGHSQTGRILAEALCATHDGRGPSG